MSGNKILLYISDNQDAVEITDSVLNAVESAANGVTEFEKINLLCEVSVTFISDEEMRELNLNYRQQDKTTDVLSFPLIESYKIGKLKEEEPKKYFLGDINPETNAVMLGDVIISAETAARQAESLNQSLSREVAFLTVHSILHLLGYDHETSVSDEEIMFQKQKEIINTIGEK